VRFLKLRASSQRHSALFLGIAGIAALYFSAGGSRRLRHDKPFAGMSARVLRPCNMRDHFHPPVPSNAGRGGEASQAYL